MIVVLDASVALKWFRQESDTAAAFAIRHAIIERKLMVRVPELIRYEVTNVLVWKGQTGAEDAIEALGTLEQLPWYIAHPSREILTTAVSDR